MKKKKTGGGTGCWTCQYHKRGQKRCINPKSAYYGKWDVKICEYYTPIRTQSEGRKDD